MPPLFRRRAERRRPQPSTTSTSVVTIMSRPGCCLCEQAEDQLRTALGVSVVVVNVDTDPELQQRYGMRVPVVLYAGEEIAEYRLTARQLQTLRARMHAR